MSYDKMPGLRPGVAIGLVFLSTGSLDPQRLYADMSDATPDQNTIFYFDQNFFDAPQDTVYEAKLDELRKAIKSHRLTERSRARFESHIFPTGEYTFTTSSRVREKLAEVAHRSIQRDLDDRTIADHYTFVHFMPYDQALKAEPTSDVTIEHGEDTITRTVANLIIAVGSEKQPIPEWAYLRRAHYHNIGPDTDMERILTQETKLLLNGKVTLDSQ